MKTYIIFVLSASLFTLSCKKENANTIKPIVSSPTKNIKITNTFKHPYYVRYAQYLDNLNSLYINHQNKKSQEGC